MNFNLSSISLNLQGLVGTAFNLFMLFVVIYSGLTMFALIRFGRSRMLALTASAAYMILVGSLYLQVALLLAKL